MSTSTLKPAAGAVLPVSVAIVHSREVSLAALAWRRYRRHPPAVVGAIVLVGLVALAALGPVVIPNDAVYRPDLLIAAKAPSLAHPLGTDEVGRDLLARMIAGGRITLTVALASVLLALSVGVLVGALAGYYRGAVDSVLMRLTDVVMSIPSFFALIVLSVILGPGLLTLIVGIGALHWMMTARIVRASFLSLCACDFVEAARAVGASDRRIIVRHILPNAFGPIVVSATLGVAAAIMIESAISYLGLGIPAPTPSWGNMLRNAVDDMWRAPWIALFPGLAIMVTVMSVNFIGDGLADALDPWSGGGGHGGRSR